MSQAKGGRSGAKEETPPRPETEAGTGPEDSPGQGHGHECLEWCPICRSTELLKGVTSPEARQQLQAIQNEAMQVVKAFAAAYAERTAEDPFSRRPGGADAGDRRDPKDPKPDDTTIDISIE